VPWQPIFEQAAHYNVPLLAGFVLILFSWLRDSNNCSKTIETHGIYVYNVIEFVDGKKYYHYEGVKGLMFHSPQVFFFEYELYNIYFGHTNWTTTPPSTVLPPNFGVTPVPVPVPVF